MENKKFLGYYTISYSHSGFQNGNLEIFQVYGMKQEIFSVYASEPKKFLVYGKEIGIFPVYVMKSGNFSSLRNKNLNFLECSGFQEQGPGNSKETNFADHSISKINFFPG